MTTELHGNTLKWAAEWIEGSFKGETDKRVVEFGKNTAMTLRATASEVRADLVSSAGVADDYVAWCRYTYDESGGVKSIVTCDSDAKGAFRVYRATPMSKLPDISGGDSERLSELMRVTSLEIKAVGGVGAATSLEMIGYIRELENQLHEPAPAPALDGAPQVDLDWALRELADGWIGSNEREGPHGFYRNARRVLELIIADSSRKPVSEDAAVAAAREECAKVAERWGQSASCDSHDENPCCRVRTGRAIAEAIRSATPAVPSAGLEEPRRDCPICLAPHHGYDKDGYVEQCPNGVVMDVASSPEPQQCAVCNKVRHGFNDDQDHEFSTRISAEHTQLQVAGRLVNVNAHGEPTRERLREIQTSVSDGYETEHQKLGRGKAMQSQLRDLHFLLTFFCDSDNQPEQPTGSKS